MSGTMIDPAQASSDERFKALLKQAEEYTRQILIRNGRIRSSSKQE